MRQNFNPELQPDLYMLQLALLRHAKSSWDHPALEDFDRPLNARGEGAAPLMAAKLAELEFVPDLVLCSPAKRTRQTLSYVQSKFQPDADRAIRFDDDIYLANASDLLDILQHRGGRAQRLLLIGHNPGLQALAMMLAGSGDAAAVALMADKFPTAALAILSFDCAHWRDIKPGSGELMTFTAPKLLA